MGICLGQVRQGENTEIGYSNISESLLSEEIRSTKIISSIVERILASHDSDREGGVTMPI
jgi:hypothetical protein